MAKKRSQRQALKTFNSWNEFLDALAKVDPKQNADHGDWCGGIRNVGHGLEIAREGWPEGSAKVAKVAAPLVEGMVRTVAAPAWTPDVTGAYYDPAEYIMGVPECWRALSPTGVKPTIRITVDVTSSCGVPAEALLTRGVAICALVQALQAEGYVVEAWYIVGIGIWRTQVDSWIRVPLTDFHGGPLDTDRVTFALAHPGAARTLGYAIDAINGGVPSGNSGEGNGSVLGHDPETTPDGWRGDLHIGPSYLDDAKWSDPADVERWVKERFHDLTSKTIHVE